MVKQSVCWFSDKGQQCRSEADAKLADAYDAIADFTEKHPIEHAVSIDEWLCENASSITPLLHVYISARLAREKEANG
jgi:hypothetical protein